MSSEEGAIDSGGEIAPGIITQSKNPGHARFLFVPRLHIIPNGQVGG